MRFKMCLMTAVCLLMTLGFSCEETGPGSINNSAEDMKRAGRQVLFEIEEMPKGAFLRFTEGSAELSDDEKEIIKKVVDPKVYTHVKFVKYEQNGETFLEVNQFYPFQIIGQDSEGHQEATGGSGSINIYKLHDNLWVPVGHISYD